MDGAGVNIVLDHQEGGEGGGAGGLVLRGGVLGGRDMVSSSEICDGADGGFEVAGVRNSAGRGDGV